jgi:hypothetical protein
MRIREAEKHTSHPDPDADPEHWKKVKKKSQKVE